MKQTRTVIFSIILISLLLTSCQSHGGGSRFFENLFFVICSIMGLGSALVLSILSTSFSLNANNEKNGMLYSKVALIGILGIGSLLLVGAYLMITEWQESLSFKKGGEMFYFVLGSYLLTIGLFIWTIRSYMNRPRK